MYFNKRYCEVSSVPLFRIYQCRQGHAICGNCYEKPQIRKCPTCRGLFIGRATVLEKIAATMSGPGSKSA